MVLPEPDEKMRSAVEYFMLSQSDVNKFFKLFDKLDKAKTGLISLEIFWTAMEYKRNIFTDTIFDVLDIDISDGEFNFCEFLVLICTYGFFETKEILQFCLYVYDQDKAGFISTDDAKQLMNILHNVVLPNIVEGNPKIGWRKLRTPADDKIDYDQLEDIHRKFPKIFGPAFILQNNMMIFFGGESWWTKHKNKLRYAKELIEAKDAKKRAKSESNAAEIKNRLIRKRMGLARYYCCPFFRYMYDPTEDHLTEDERRKKETELALARRKVDLEAKNPETAPWRKYKEKMIKHPDSPQKYSLRNMKPPRPAAQKGWRIELVERKREENEKISGLRMWTENSRNLKRSLARQLPK